VNDDVTIQRVVVPSLPNPLTSHHPHCVVANGLIFVSGLVSVLQSDGLRVGVQKTGEASVHDLRLQLKSIFRQLDMILDCADSDKSMVVDVQVFLRDLNKNFPIMNDEYREYFETAMPARTTVGVVSFPSDVVVELKVIAMAKGGFGVR
jgi:2-iminobutanoate/2-iminopropanoate deaminase